TVDSKVADWVNHIPAGSIRTWDELGLRFLEHFAGNCRPKRHFTHLASVRQKHGESLKNFLIRWRKESREVEGTDDKSRLAMFTAALQYGLLHTDLTTHPPDTFEEAMVRARSTNNQADWLLRRPPPHDNAFFAVHRPTIDD
ncbi:unnamed protein product, partial [Cuscuta campestris]